MSLTTVANDIQGGTPPPLPVPVPNIVIPAGPPPGMTPDVMVEKYVALRDKVTEIKARHAAELAPYNLVMGTLGGWLLDVLNRNKQRHMSSPAGTFGKVTHSRATVENWAAVLAYIRENGAWHLLEQRVSKTVAVRIIEETEAPIPGVKVYQEVVLNVRRGS